MIDSLITFMGLWGVRALISWVAALLVFVLGCTIRSRARAFFLALVFVFAAWMCAQKNLNGWYASIRTDRSDEIKAALADRAPQEGLATVVRYAEDDPEDRVEGGVFRSPPAWRAGGVKQRGGGVAPEGEEAAGRTPVLEEGEEQLIYMKGEQVSWVRMIERGNRLAINILIFLILLALVWDYASTFNSVWSSRLPLPLSSSWIDALSAKPRKVAIYPDVEEQWSAASFLSRAVRKGENLIYFGENPIWEEKETLPRLSLFGLPVTRIPIFRYGAAGLPRGSECAFDAAWFGRYVVTVTQDAPIQDMVLDFVDILTERRRSGACSEQTFVIAWDRDEALEPSFLAAMEQFSNEANLSLVIWSREKLVDPESTSTSTSTKTPIKLSAGTKIRIKTPLKPRTKMKVKAPLKPTTETESTPSTIPEPEPKPSTIPEPESKSSTIPEPAPKSSTIPEPAPKSNTEDDLKSDESPKADLKPSLNLPPKLDDFPLKPDLNLPPKLDDLPLKPGLKLPPKPSDLALRPGLKLPPKPSLKIRIKKKTPLKPGAKIKLNTEPKSGTSEKASERKPEE